MRTWIAALLMGFVASAASAADVEMQSSYQATWDAVAHDADCQMTGYPDFTLFTCEKSMTFWYFTKPNNAAHPGIVKRSMIEATDGAFSVTENGRSFGSDEAQPAFKTWMDSIVALDQKVKEEVARKAQGEQQQ